MQDKKKEQYEKLIKPNWAPPFWFFGLVWNIVYIAIAFSFGSVFQKAVTKTLPTIVVLPFALNLVFNLSFNYFQPRLKGGYLNLINILLVFITLIWSMVSIFPYLKWITFSTAPYLLWIVFILILEISILKLNHK